MREETVDGQSRLMSSNPDRRGYIALRNGRYSMRNGCHLLTTVTADREPWFADEHAARAVASLHAGQELFADAELLAWVLMPDHWHGLLRLGESLGLPELMNRFKTRSAIAANAVLRRRGRLWFAGYHDRAVRNEAHLNAAASYVLQNPVKAGLSELPTDYPWLEGSLIDVGPRGPPTEITSALLSVGEPPGPTRP